MIVLVVVILISGRKHCVGPSSIESLWRLNDMGSSLKPKSKIRIKVAHFILAPDINFTTRLEISLCINEHH